MKKLGFLFLIMLLLSSCSSEFKQIDLSLHEKNSNIRISFGMKKKVVDGLIGESEIKTFLGIYLYNGVEVFYRDNKVVGLLLEDGQHEQTEIEYLTPREIGLGSTLEEVKEKYGEPMPDNMDNDRFILYIFEEIDGSFTRRNSKEEVENKDKAYVISIAFSDGLDKGLTILHMFDYQFAFEMN